MLAPVPVTQLTRPLPLASVASVTVHIVIMLAVGLLYAQARLAGNDTLPVLSLHLSAAEPGKAASEEGTNEAVLEEADEAARPSIAATEQPELAPESPDTVPEPPTPNQVEREATESLSSDPQRLMPPPAAAQAMTALHESAQPPSEPAPSLSTPTDPPAPSASAEQVLPGIERADLVATVGLSSRTVATAAPGPERADSDAHPLSERQQKMLDKRIERWAHNIERLAAEPDLEWKHRGQLYTAKFEHRPAEDNTGLDEAVITVSTEQDGRRMSTEMVMRRLAFSQFGQFVNRWDPAVKIHDDYIDGRFHSNSEVQLSYSRKVVPQFDGRVTIAGRRVRIHDASGLVSRDEMFRGGLETGVRSIALPHRYVPFDTGSAVKPEQVHRFGEHTRLVFHADGSYAYSPLNAIDGRERRMLAETTQYLLAEGRARLHVSGTINGKVLIYSPRSVVIEGTLRYANDPRSDAGSDDFVGIVSDRTVEIAAQRITGAGDLRIDAAIFAKRSFRVRDYRSGDTDLLHLYGSLTAGSLDATEPRYRTRIEFDDRLEHVRPPAFPVTERFEITARDGNWRLH